MLDKARAEQLAEELDTDSVFACSACLFDLAWSIYQGERLHWQTIGATARTTWFEMAASLEAAVVEARMREVPFAEDGLADLRERTFQSALARAVVHRLAVGMAEEIASRHL